MIKGGHLLPVGMVGKHGKVGIEEDRIASRYMIESPFWLGD